MTNVEADKVTANSDDATANETPVATDSKSLDDAALDEVAGGINPQPLPPIPRVSI